MVRTHRRRKRGQFPVTFVHVFQGGEAEENTTSDLDDEDVENVEEYEKDDDDEEKEEDKSVEVTTTTTKKKEYQNEINDFVSTIWTHSMIFAKRVGQSNAKTRKAMTVRLLRPVTTWKWSTQHIYGMV